MSMIGIMMTMMISTGMRISTGTSDSLCCD